jgi:hypothetical protein
MMKRKELTWWELRKVTHITGDGFEINHSVL